MELNFSLHPGQLQVFKQPSRFKCIAAGRRWGKTRYAAVEILTKALEEETTVNGRPRSLEGMEVWYVAPTFDQARDIIWGLFKQLAQPVIRKTWENDGKIQLLNGRCIQIKGSDRPDRLRGVGLSHVVLDEFASMKPVTWEEILRPTLADVAGSATFIGTPLGKNWFYDLYTQALVEDGWTAWHFESADNPYLPHAEIEAAKRTMPREVFKQEFEASFHQSGKLVFPYDLQVIPEKDVPVDGPTYLAVDPAGFYTEGQIRQRVQKLDETAIAVVRVTPQGWYVLDVPTGRWDVRETSIRILREAQKHRPILLGIEAGMQKNAIDPYLRDQMRRLNVYPQVVPLRHGGKDKASRIAWALQGRMEHGRIFFQEGDYLKSLQEQIHDFPYGRHDDMVDALAYIDQIASTLYVDEAVQDTWTPVDTGVAA